MNSCLYISKLKHKRIFPKKNSFAYSIYSMFIDLDELEELNKKYFLFSYNKFNLMSFFDEDHFKFIDNKNRKADIISQEKIKYQKEKYQGKKTKEKIELLIKEMGLDFELGKVFVLTNLRIFGYIFNPVSFYYCFDKNGVFKVFFSEVNNTFGDQKMYALPIEKPDSKTFKFTQRKNYYISPFIDFDNDLNWEFELPGEDYKMFIDSIKKDQVELKTSLLGKRSEISNAKLFFLNIRYPMITVVIIFLIHYQALKLFVKKIQFFRKEETDDKIIKAMANK